MRGPNHPMFFWRKDKTWYCVDDNLNYKLTEQAPPKARESFAIYEQEMLKRKQGIYA